MVTRKGWDGKDQFLYLVPGSKFKVSRPPLQGVFPEGTEVRYGSHIDIRTSDGEHRPWHASQADLLADDWYVVADT